jgi:serine/threonine protein kinase
VSDAFPAEFGRYQLIERIAIGGMAELFKARVVGAHGFVKTVVIKKILPHLAGDSSFVAMFIDEAKITARLDHPKIAQVLELGTLAEGLYIAMEYVDGVDVLAVLRSYAHKKQPVPAHLAVHIAHEVLDALDYAHHARDDLGTALGIVHRDISPSNVLISRRGDVKLADFGIAHALDRQNRTQAGMLKGKYGYMSPEQVIGGDIDSRSDLFSVGIILAEMLMGRRLFAAQNELDVLLMVRDVRLERFYKHGMAIPEELRAVVLRALERDPKNRYQSAAGFREVLADWLFSKRQRVTPADLAAMVEGIGPARGPMTPVAAFEPPRVEPATPPPHPVPPPAPPRKSEPAPPATGAPGPIGPAPSARAPTAPASGSRARRNSPEIPIVVGEVEEAVPQEEPVVLLSKRHAAPPALEPETSQPVVTIERFPDAQIAAELEAELERIIGPDLAAAGAAALGEARERDPAAPDTNEADFLDLSVELDLDQPQSPSMRPISETRIPTVEALVPGARNVRPGEEASETGDLGQMSPIRILYRLAVDKSSGLLVVELPAGRDKTGITKEIFLSSGNPEYVTSNLARELFGEYLVSQRVISSGELSMALAMMPHFGGRLGDTLVGLGLLKPLDVFRQLTRQVREKIVDVCTWQKGTYRWYAGRKTTRDSFPLGLDAFEVLGAGATALPGDLVEAWAAPSFERLPVAAKNARVVPEAFRLGSYPRDVYNRLDGRSSLRQHMARYTSSSDRLAFLRTLYLLNQTDLAFWV